MYSFGSNYYGCLGLSDDDVDDDDVEEVLRPTLLRFFSSRPVEQVRVNLLCRSVEMRIYVFL